MVQQHDVRVLPKLVLRHVGLEHFLGAQAPRRVARGYELVEYVHGQVGHVLLHRVALLARRLAQRRQQPSQQIARAGARARW